MNTITSLVLQFLPHTEYFKLIGDIKSFMLL